MGVIEKAYLPPLAAGKRTQTTEPIGIFLSVVICTHKRPLGLERLLRSLAPQVLGRADRQLIVVNDGTHSKAYEQALAPFSSIVRYEVQPTAIGTPRARNRSAALASGEFLVFTDDDCQATPHWLDWLDATLRTHPELDVLSGTTSPLNPSAAKFLGRVQAHFGLLPRPHVLQGLEQAYVTSCLAVRASTFRQVGWFNEDPLFRIASEDSELSLRLTRAQARTKIDKDWRVFHELSTSLRAEARRFWRYGFANGNLARSPSGPFSSAYLLSLRRRDLPRRFIRYYRETREESEGFAANPIQRFASRMVVAFLRTVYDAGAADGVRAPRSGGEPIAP